MANIDRIININILLQTTALSQQSFSDMMVFGPHVLGLTRTMIVTSPDDLINLGMSITDPIYLAVADCFDQVPCVRQVYIGRQTVDDITLAVPSTVAIGNVFTFLLSYKVSGVLTTTPITVTATGTTGASVVTQFLAAITTATVPFTATNASGALKLVPNPVQPFGVKITTTNVTVLAQTVTEAPAVGLAACKAESNVWYGLIVPNRTPAVILAVAAWVESAKKLFLTAVAEPAAIDPGSVTDTMYLLKAGNFFRTACFYHALAATEFVEAALMAEKFTLLPGQETWANQQLAGVTADNLAEGDAATVFAKNGNTFEPFRNISITQNGKVAGGEWIDVIRFRDWLQEQIQINIFGRMVNNRIAYTDPGIRSIGSLLRQALDLGVSRGGIAPEELDDNNNIIPSYVVSLPRSADVAFNDKATRVLNDVTFSARLAGAIHAVNVQGTLSYTLN